MSRRDDERLMQFLQLAMGGVHDFLGYKKDQQDRTDRQAQQDRQFGLQQAQFTNLQDEQKSRGQEALDRLNASIANSGRSFITPSAQTAEGGSTGSYGAATTGGGLLAGPDRPPDMPDASSSAAPADAGPPSALQPPSGPLNGAAALATLQAHVQPPVQPKPDIGTNLDAYAGHGGVVPALPSITSGPPPSVRPAFTLSDGRAVSAIDPSQTPQGRADAFRLTQDAELTKRKQQRAQVDMGIEFPQVAAQYANTPDADFVSALAAARGDRMHTKAQAATAELQAGKPDKVQVVKGDDGKYHVINLATGTEQNVGLGAAQSGGGTQTSSGAKTSIGDMIAQHERMAAAENAPGFQVSRSGQVVEGAQYGASRHAAKGDAPSIGQSLVLLGGSLIPGIAPTDQEKSYLTSGRAYGDEAAKAFKSRQNEEAVLREVATLAAEPTDTPETVAHKQQRRAAIIGMAITQNPQFAANHPDIAKKYGGSAPATDVQAKAAAIMAKYQKATTP